MVSGERADDSSGAGVCGKEDIGSRERKEEVRHALQGLLLKVFPGGLCSLSLFSRSCHYL